MPEPSAALLSAKSANKPQEKLPPPSINLELMLSLPGKLSRRTPPSLPHSLLPIAQNSLQSTGPKSLEGKTRASLNAVKTGLTGNTVLLPSDNATQYELHLHRFTTQFKPLGDRENELVQSLANTQWRINRIPSLETGIYALARIEFAEKFAAYDPAEAAALIQAQAFITYHKQLNNRTVQEARLRRQYAKDSAELARVQAERVEQELKQPRSAPLPQPVFEPENLHDTENGFEYSSASLHALEDHLNLDPGGLGLPKAA